MLDPKDFALLNDRLDGRLDAAAAEDLRRRIDVEADLAAAWDDLRRIREGLRSMPAPSVPPGFLEGIHARAAAGDAASGAPASGHLRRWLYAAAALVGLGAGLSAYLLSQRGDGAARTDTAARVDEGTRLKEAAQPENLLEGDAIEGRLRRDRLAAAEKFVGSPGARPATVAGRDAEVASPQPPQGPLRLGGPGGSVPPGLREAGDEKPAAPPEARKAAPPPSVARPAPAAAPPPAPPAAPLTPTTPPPPSADDQPALKKLEGMSKGYAAANSKDAPTLEAPLRLAATDYDEARARLALLVAAIRRGDRTEEAGKEFARRADERESAADAREILDKAKTGGLPPADVVLGSFVFALTPEQAESLARALGEGAIGGAKLGAGGAPPAGAEPSPVGSKPASSKPVAVRIVVVKR